MKICSVCLVYLGSLFSAVSAETGSVIFIHPDGAGLGHWNAYRILKSGPDGMTHWDRLDEMAIYRGHQKNWLSTSSHGGATAHAYGKKVHYDSYGMDYHSELVALSGKPMSIMEEAIEAGIAVGVVNSGHLAEPGTGVFLASAQSRGDKDSITAQIIESGAQVIFSGGERFLLPEGVSGHHGGGERKDGRDMIQEATDLGYRVIYTRDALMELPSDVEKVLGVFAHNHTFNDKPEEELNALGLENFDSRAPTLAEMTEVALRILGRKERQFFLVVEEEATDNFSNCNNAKGMLDALGRADEAIGVATQFVNRHGKVLLLTAADSDAGHPTVIAHKDERLMGKPLPERFKGSGPIDGRDGTGTLPFISAPDAQGEVFEFGICWATFADMPGSVLARAHGFNAENMPNHLDNTDVYRLMYQTLWGTLLP